MIDGNQIAESRSQAGDTAERGSALLFCGTQIARLQRSDRPLNAARRVPPRWRRILYLLLAAACLLPADFARAFCVSNHTGRTLHVRLLNGGALDQNVPAGGRACNAIIGANVNVRLRVRSLNSDAIDFEAEVDGKGGGYVNILEEDRSALGVPNNIYLRSFDQNDAFFRTSARGLRSASRDVRFLVAADGQYSTTWNGGDWLPTKAIVDATHEQMTGLVGALTQVRGILYAGDMTQFASDLEYNAFTDSFAGYERYLFHGLGNHDTPWGFEGRWARMIRFVGEARRETVKTSKPSDADHPHYSWDWHDVHFVQLNLYPGSIPIGDQTNNDPRRSLEFLANDLTQHVGDSGRPVVLLHHFGLESFSTGYNCDPIGQPACTNSAWWFPEHRLAYWNVLADYNVLGIFTGHSHFTWIEDPLVLWPRPTGATGGPASITTFNGAAAQNQVYLDVTIDDSDRMTVNKIEASDRRVWYVHTVGTGRRTIPVVKWSSGTGGNPHNNATDAHAAVARINAECGATNRTIRFDSAHYPGAVRFSEPKLRVTAKNGTVRIGGL